MKVQIRNSLEPQLECNQDQDQTSLMNQGSLTFLTILGVTKILCSFILVLEGKTGKGSVLKFLYFVLAGYI